MSDFTKLKRLGNLRPKLIQQTENLKEVMLGTHQISEEMIIRVIRGPVRVEVYNQGDIECVSAQVFYSGIEFPLLLNTRHLSKVDVYRINIVSLAYNAEIHCYERDSYEDYLLKEAPERYRAWNQVQQTALINIFSDRQVFGQGQKKNDELYENAVRNIMVYLVGQEDPNLLMMEYRGALEMKVKCKTKVVLTNHQSAFARSAGMSASSWSRKKDQLTERQILVDADKGKQKHGITINLIELIQQHPKLFNEVVNEYDQAINQLKVMM